MSKFVFYSTVIMLITTLVLVHEWATERKNKRKAREHKPIPHHLAMRPLHPNECYSAEPMTLDEFQAVLDSGPLVTNPCKELPRNNGIGNVIESVKQHKEKEVRDLLDLRLNQKDYTVTEEKLGEHIANSYSLTAVTEMTPAEIAEKFGDDVVKNVLPSGTPSMTIIKEEDMSPDDLNFFKSLKMKDGKIIKKSSKE